VRDSYYRYKHGDSSTDKNLRSKRTTTPTNIKNRCAQHGKQVKITSKLSTLSQQSDKPGRQVSTQETAKMKVKRHHITVIAQVHRDTFAQVRISKQQMDQCIARPQGSKTDNTKKRVDNTIKAAMSASDHLCHRYPFLNNSKNSKPKSKSVYGKTCLRLRATKMFGTNRLKYSGVHGVSA